MALFEQGFDEETGEITFRSVAEDGTEFTFSIGPTKGTDDGGFQFEFPDGEGGRLVLKFIPDIANTALIVKGGRPGGPFVSTTVNLT